MNASNILPCKFFCYLNGHIFLSELLIWSNSIKEVFQLCAVDVRSGAKIRLSKSS